MQRNRDGALAAYWCVAATKYYGLEPLNRCGVDGGGVQTENEFRSWSGRQNYVGPILVSYIVTSGVSCDLPGCCRAGISLP